MKWIIWGTGKWSKYLFHYMEQKNELNNIVMVVDSDNQKWEKIWLDYKIQSPEKIKEVEFDKIIVAVWIWRPIYNMLVNEWKIESYKVDNLFFYQKAALLKYYAEKKNIDYQIELQLKYIKEHQLDIFNDKFVENYIDKDIEVGWDNEKALFYVIHLGKKMYFPKKYNSKRMVADYYCSLLLEQDKESPHRYLSDKFQVKEGDIVLDAGVAEGNFSLEIVERVKKLYLIEMDKEWIEALQYTFEPYMEKVCIVSKFLTNKNDDNCITIDKLIDGGQLDVVKMDVEGSETDALKGGKNTFINNNITAAICSYHKENDYNEISSILKQYNYNVCHTKGYMVFINEKNFVEREKTNVPKFVRGVIYANKEI